MIKIRSRTSLPSDTVLVAPAFLKKWNLSRNQSLLLQFGITTIPIKLTTSEKVAQGQLLVSDACMNQLKIPAEGRFQVRKDGNTLIVGPYIGILVDKIKGRLPFQNLIHYTKMYGHINGALLAFSPEDVNLRAKTIRGFMYSPAKKTWISGQYRYPSSIFNKSLTSHPLMSHFQHNLGKTIFNDFRLDKWSMHKLLSRNVSVRTHLPRTILYQRPQDIARMFEHSEELYMKPVQGSFGSHILKLSKQNNRITVTHKGSLKKHFHNLQELGQFLQKQTHHSGYLIQERIKLVSSKERLIDFRLILVKNGHGHWQRMGIISRLGPRRSIVSNISKGGTAIEGKRMLRRILHRGEAEARATCRRMEKVARNIAMQLVSSGYHAANLGFDFALDTQNKLWIIEVNHNDPNPTIALDAGEKQMFHQTIKANMLYAKKLAGFGTSHPLKGRQ
ncbi:YheC/YheD family protein [Paenibacillus lupini]|uniref:YheC/YheD family endospore coat-associated protein n=1 Tax=Paenibacillus lupini TaxID=1450204 RepID=UPI00141EEB91|nr:YheC/YheD family protein [Paenibacillus lupini]NIK23117.1 glutathione synthase/RimK-type ligase-like ATP-grasp enzyme [Paenibacillus lupini]